MRQKRRGRAIGQRALLGMAALLGLVTGVGGFFLLGGGGGGGAAGNKARPPVLIAVQTLPAELAAEPNPLPMRGPEAADPNPQPAEPDEEDRLALPEQGSALRDGGAALLAIVIDDIGYSLRQARDFLALELPLSFSILPNLPHSENAAALFQAEGRDFLVHLPMEPVDFPNVNPGPTPLLLEMDEGDAARRTASFFVTLPGAVGASNHMGSAYTLDDRRMGAVQRVVAGSGRFFLNSKTSLSAVPRRIARARGYAYLERSVFLDNDRADAAIRRQLRQAMRIARKHGQAVAIGHPYRETLRVLGRALPGRNGASREGVTLVPISTLVQALPGGSGWNAGRDQANGFHPVSGTHPAPGLPWRR